MQSRPRPDMVYIMAASILLVTAATGLSQAADESASPDDGWTAAEHEAYGQAALDNPGVNRDVVIVHDTLPIVFFGMYRASQMTSPGWCVLERSINWANGFAAPATTTVWLATYNGTLDPSVSAERDGIAVYNFLIHCMGFDASNINVAPQTSIETASFAGYDLVIYAWAFPRDATNVLTQNKPFVTFSAGETDELGIGSGVQTMHESRTDIYGYDNSHSISSPLRLGRIDLDRAMFMDASTASGNGVVLVTADDRSCPSDINGDRAVNVLDLLQLLGAWGGCP